MLVSATSFDKLVDIVDCIRKRLPPEGIQIEEIKHTEPVEDIQGLTPCWLSDGLPYTNFEPHNTFSRGDPATL